MGKRYTTNETTLCTYAALYDVQELGGYAAFATVTGRESRLFHDKVRNIVAMLDKHDILMDKPLKHETLLVRRTVGGTPLHPAFYKPGAQQMYHV